MIVELCKIMMNYYWIISNYVELGRIKKREDEKIM